VRAKMGAPANLPIDLEIALLCDRFKVLPSQLAKEDVRTMRRITSLLAEWERDIRKRN
jgi:hypothetical protein